MGLFNFFKKKNPPSQPAPAGKPAPAPSVPAPPPAPAPSVPAPPPAPVVQEHKPVASQPKPADVPVQGAAPAAKPNPPRSTEKPHNQRGPYVNWPKYGTTTAELVALTRVKVFLDASFVRSPGFAAFREAWGKGRVNQYATRYYFIPSFEKKKLTDQEQAMVSGEDCREFICADLTDCFAQMVRKGLNWNILWLTDSSETGTAAQTAARSTNALYLRWYGMDAAGKLKSIALPVSDRPARKEMPKAAMLFAQPGTIAPIGRTANPVQAVPTSGSAVVAPGNAKRYVLGAPVMTDHASITYKTNDGSVFAKIYTANALRIDLFENKAKRMVAEKINIPGVCWPQDVLTDKNGAFVGVLVPASAGVQLTRSVFEGASGISKHFAGWDKRDICTVAGTILRTYCAVRDTGVLFGCFNPSAVYVESPRKVYFVDTDGWQIEGYPSLSRNLTFTPPELLANKDKLHMYTADEDNYQAALLAFMMMLPGKYPYAKFRRKNEDDSLRNMSFPFSISEDLRRSADAERPSGAWQIVWDHLPYKMCFSFYHSFHQNGDHAKPGTRLPASSWVGLIEQYAKHLDTAEGVQSRPLFPFTFRRDARRTFVRCNICGKEHPSFYFLRTITVQQEKVNIWDKGYRVCLPCSVDQSKDPKAKFTCKSCNKTFYYTNRTQIMHEIGKLDFDWSEQKWCYSCKRQKHRCGVCGRETPIYQLREFRDEDRNLKRTVCGECFGKLVDDARKRREERKNQVYRSVVCRNCNRYFSITVGEAEFYSKKGMHLPSRCPRCRGR